MSGHSKWSTIKRKKGATDAKRGQAFSKIVRTITIAVKENGEDPEMNYKLRLAIDKAKEINMPQATIDRAISGAKKEGANLEEIIYEAYGPEGTAFLIKVATDNRNRASADIKAVLAKNNGSIGGSGSVLWMFEQKGIVALNSSSINKDEVELLAIDLGAEEIKEDGNTLEIYTTPDKLHKLSVSLREKGIKIESENIEMEPKNVVKIENEQKAEKILKLVDQLEDLEDVDEVYANFDIPEKLMVGIK